MKSSLSFPRRLLVLPLFPVFLAVLALGVWHAETAHAQDTGTLHVDWKTPARKLQLEDSPEAIAARAKADIPAYFLEAYEMLRQYPPYLTGSSPQDDGGLAKAKRSSIDDMLNYMSATLQVARHTESDELMELGAKLYDILLARLMDRSDTKREENIFDQNNAASLGLAAEILHDAGRLDERRLAPLRELAVFIAKRRFDTWPEPNLADAPENLLAYEGAAHLAKVFPDMPELATMREHATAHFDAIIKRGALKSTDGSLSTARGLCALILTAQANGRFAELKALRPTFEWFRDQVPPSGYVPRFGRDDWRVTPLWIPVLASGEALFGDGTFRYAAKKVFATYKNHQAANHKRKMVLKGIDSHYVMSLLGLPDATENVSDPVAPTILNQRIGEDRIILRTGHGPDASQLFMDLNARPEGTPDRRPAIAGYESSRVPLSRGADKALPRAQNGNLLFLLQDGLKFPFPASKIKEIEDAERERLFRYDYWDAAQGGRFVDHFELGDVVLTNRKTDAYANLHFPVYGTDDTSLRRQILLTGEGVVIIRDDLTPGKSARRMSAGSLWHTEANGDESLESVVHQGSTGPFADCDSGEERDAHLLVLHAPLGGAEAGTAGSAVFDDWLVTKAARGATVTGKSTFSTVRLKEGQAQTFLTVVVPFPANAETRKVADGVRAGQVGENDIRVSVRRSAETLRVLMSADGTWKASRIPNGAF